jgi:hypothetical protein
MKALSIGGRAKRDFLISTSVVDSVPDCDGLSKAVAFGSKPTSCSLATGKLRHPSAELVVDVILG